MTLPQPVEDAVTYFEGSVGSYPDIAPKWQTIRAELHRLTEIAEGVDPLVIRLGEVTTRLEAANAKLREIRDSTFRSALVLRSMADRHLQGAGDEA